MLEDRKPARSHASSSYICSFCRMVQGDFSPPVLSASEDIIWQDDDVFAFISVKQWPNNLGHALIVPVAHYENLYELPDELGAAIHRLARRIALAMKSAYGCEGISTRQHNEPAGDQDVWHYHLHVFPRWTGDNLYGSTGAIAPVEERRLWAQQLRGALQNI